MPCSCGKGVNCKCIKKKPTEKSTFDQTSTVCGLCKLPTTANVLTGTESSENVQGETCTCFISAVGFSSEAVGQSTVESTPNVDPQTSAAGGPDKQSETDSWERKETDSSDLYPSSSDLHSISENKSDSENINTVYINIYTTPDQLAEFINSGASPNLIIQESVNNSTRENEFDNSRALNTENQENVHVQNFMSQEQLPDTNQQTGLASNANVVPALAEASTVENERRQFREKVEIWMETLEEPSNSDVIQDVPDDDVEQQQARGPPLNRKLSFSSETDESASNPRPEEQRRRPRRKMAKKDDGKFSKKK